MGRLTLLAVAVLTIVSMAVSPALAHDWDNDGWDEEFGFWVPVLVVFDGYFDDFDFDDFDFDHHGRDHHDRCEGPVCLID